MAESEELKNLLIKVKEESEKICLKFNTQRTKIMAASLITSWQIDGETMETVTDFIFWAPKSLQMLTAVVQSLSHVQLCDPMDCSTPGFPVLHHRPEFTQVHVV